MTIEAKLRKTIKENLEVVLAFDPYARYDGVSNKQEFLNLLNNDPAFAPFQLANERYAIARVGGNLVTSLHRKLGDIYESLFWILLKENLSIPENDLHYQVNLDVNGRIQTRSTDGFVNYSLLERDVRVRIKEIARKDDAIGMAFEVRSCYQIGDSKRIQADRDLALALEKENIEPVMLIFCITSLKAPVRRLSGFWSLYQGHDTFNFVKHLTGFDLYHFLMSEQDTIGEIVNKIFEEL